MARRLNNDPPLLLGVAREKGNILCRAHVGITFPHSLQTTSASCPMLVRFQIGAIFGLPRKMLDLVDFAYVYTAYVTLAEMAGPTSAILAKILKIL